MTFSEYHEALSQFHRQSKNSVFFSIPKLHVVQPGDRDVRRRRRQRHRLHDGEGLRVEDVDGGGLGPQDEAGDGALLGVALLQGRDARDYGLTLQREALVEVHEGLLERRTGVRL